jgi:hypothetical protein
MNRGIGIFARTADDHASNSQYQGNATGSEEVDDKQI